MKTPAPMTVSMLVVAMAFIGQLNRRLTKSAMMATMSRLMVASAPAPMLPVAMVLCGQARKNVMTTIPIMLTTAPTVA